MKKTFLPRSLAMLLCLALLGATALAEEAEPVDAPVQEQAEFTLGEAEDLSEEPVPVQESAEDAELPAPSEDPEELLIAAPEAEGEAPAEAAPEAADPGVRLRIWPLRRAVTDEFVI